METHQLYPVNLSIEYPGGPRNRVSAFFRILTIIPILIILSLLFISETNNSENQFVQLGISGFVVLPTVLMILFRKKYPAWWFAWNLHMSRFIFRVLAYLLLLRDEYPSTDQEQAVHVHLAYPDAKQNLNRFLPLFKWLFAVPHYIVLALLFIIVLLVTLIAWFAILFTGRYPKDMFIFVTGTLRWLLRVEAYAFLLTTDVYPPFKLEA